VARFSQRVAGRLPFTSGLSEASGNLRTATWNVLHYKLFPAQRDSDWQRYQSTAKILWNHFHWRIDEVPHYAHDGQKFFRNHWFGWPWPDFFDALEFAVQLLEPQHNPIGQAKWYESINAVLEEEGCAYRFIARELAPVTNPTEMTEVQSAAECAIAPVAEHIREALGCLPPNPNSSPRNSVKESISAVEAAFKHLVGQPTATLGEGLKLFEKKFGPLHASIRRGLDHLYAYTNGPDGIRHALVDDAAEVTIDDARFMVVTCSAFVNYLIALAS
jgi:hypothetical protein